MIRIARFVSLAAGVVGLAAPVAAHAQKDGKPTVAILSFTNGCRFIIPLYGCKASFKLSVLVLYLCQRV